MNSNPAGMFEVSIPADGGCMESTEAVRVDTDGVVLGQLATLQFTCRNSLDAEDRARVAAWLRKQAEDVESDDPKLYDPRFRARIFPVPVAT